MNALIPLLASYGRRRATLTLLAGIIWASFFVVVTNYNRSNDDKINSINNDDGNRFYDNLFRIKSYWDTVAIREEMLVMKNSCKI